MHLVPMWLLYSLLGYSHFLSRCVPLAATLFSLLAVFVLARRAWNLGTAVLAGLFFLTAFAISFALKVETYGRELVEVDDLARGRAAVVATTGEAEKKKTKVDVPPFVDLFLFENERATQKKV